MFELIEVARLFVEEMDDDIAVIKHSPAALCAFVAMHAFQMERADILRQTQLLQQGILDGFGLARVIDSGDDEEMGQRGQFVNIEQDDVRGLFVLDNL